MTKATSGLRHAVQGYLRRNFAATEDLNRQVILETLPKGRGGILLDLGCGDGAFTGVLSRHVAADATLGVELDEALATRAAASGVDVRRADLGESLPVASESVDVVHANQVIEHLPRTDHFMAELRRVLRPDGCAVVSTNNLASLHNVAALLVGWQPMPAHVSDEHVGLGNPANPFRGDPGAPGQMHLRLFTARALTELAAVHGLRIEVARTAGFYPLPARAARVANRLLPHWGAFLVQRFGCA